MKKIALLFTAVVALAVAATSCNKTPQATLKTPVDSMSYAVGVNMGAGFKQQITSIPGGEVNVDNMIAGFAQALKGDETKITAEDAIQVINNYFTRVQNEIATQNKEEGAKFLAENKTKDGVKTTESGLQYRVITEGTGKQPKADSEVTVNYRGTLIDGTEFDKNDSISFNASGVIKGWTEGLQLMKEGAEYEFVIPSELGYGEQGAGQSIKPNSTLIFNIKLISVK